jgi:hypothetical protein
MIDPEDGHVYYWPASNPALAAPGRGVPTAMTATLFDYFNDLWADAAQVDAEHVRIDATVHTCTHAARLADVAVLEAGIHDARQRLADLLAYTNRARTPGQREYHRLGNQPYATALTIETYVRDVLDLLGAPQPGALHPQPCRPEETPCPPPT